MTKGGPIILPPPVIGIYFYFPACEWAIQRDHKMKINSTQFFESDNNQSNIVFDEYSTVYNCETHCCICQVLLNTQAIELTTNARIDLLVDHNIYVPPYTHVCSKHIISDRLSLDIFVNHK